MSRLSEHFISEEFIPKKMHLDIVRDGFDPRWFVKEQAVLFLEWLKMEKCGGAKITLNDHYWTGRLNFRGLRSARFPSKSFFRKWATNFSQHRYMNALDFSVEGYTPEQISEIIKVNYDYIHKTFGITTIEDWRYTRSWTHVDWRWTGLTYLKIVRPTTTLNASK